jgi:hypothetical protein
MKIVLISQSATPGILIFRKTLIKHLIAQGYTVYAFAMDYSEKTQAAVREFGAIPVSYQLNKTGFNLLQDIKHSWQLSRQLKHLQPHVVLSFFIKPSLWGTLAAKWAKVPRRIAMIEGLGHIYTPEKTGFSTKKKILQIIHGRLCRLVYRNAHEVWFLNQDDLNDLKQDLLMKLLQRKGMTNAPKQQMMDSMIGGYR